MKDKNYRSITKSISWRVIATLTTMVLVFIFTGKVILSIGIGMLEVILKIIFYYYHERVWNRINWGKEIKRE